MKKLILLLFIPLISFGQQFSFKDLTEMIMSQSLYERKNITNGNASTRYEVADWYEFECINPFMIGGGYGNPDDCEGEMIYLETSKDVKSSFAEGYNKESKTATTFYDLHIIKDIENIILGPYEPKYESRQLKIQYNNPNHYKAILKQIDQTSEYIGMNSEYSKTWYTYVFNELKIEISKNDDNDGGTIFIVFGIHLSRI
jgi:hypothetical protein